MTNLFISYYKATTPERQEEIDFCLKANCENPLIDNIYVLQGGAEIFSFSNSKIKTIISEDKPTYSTFIVCINSRIETNQDINIISNADIIFDQSLAHLDKLKENDCWALSRWEMNPKYEKHPEQIQTFGDSQDCWMFRGKIKQLDKADFPMGKMGCIDGNMLINYKRGNRQGGRKIKLSDLFYKFNGIKCNSTKFKKEGIDTELESYDFEKGIIIYNKILSVIDSGTKETIKISFESGNHLICTKDHLILSDSKEYKEAISLKIGDNVICKKTTKSIKKKKYHDRKVTYTKFHPFAEKKKVRGHSYMRVRDQRLSYDSNLNGLDFDLFVEILNTDSERSKKLLYSDPKMEIHHLDENPQNNLPNNLLLLSKSDHAKLHSITSINNRMKTDTETIIGISENGLQKVYDIEMESPHNNFCANGIVVHNCDNRIAYEIKKAGYNISNPSRTIHTWHLHNSGVRGYNPAIRNEDTVVSQPYLNVPVTSL